MVYIRADGSVTQERTYFRFSIITDLLWSILNIISLFFSTLSNPKKPIPRLGRPSPPIRARGGGKKGGGDGGDSTTRRAANIRQLDTKASCSSGS